MPNRVIKDSIWSSPSLAQMSEAAQDHWPRWLLLADDWGCFNADADVIKGTVYPKRKKITVKRIEVLSAEYYAAGKLFLWSEGGRVWGFFTSFGKHHPNFCNSTHVDGDGKQVRHKRKTPEPPEKELKVYFSKYVYKKPGVGGDLESKRAAKSSYRVPSPVLNPNPIPVPNPAGDEKEEIPEVYVTAFKTFFQTYPPRNGTRVGKAKAQEKFNELEIREIPLILKAVKNYAGCKDVKNNIGIKDAHRFIRDGKGHAPWQDWIAPTVVTKAELEKMKRQLRRVIKAIKAKVDDGGNAMSEKTLRKLEAQQTELEDTIKELME